MSFLRLFQIVAAALLANSPFVTSFGARLEPFSHHQGGYSSSRGGTSFLRVFESKRNNGSSTRGRYSTETEETMSFHQLLDVFDFPPAAYQNLNDFVVAHGMIDGTFSHLRRQADLLASETFEVGPLMTETTRDDCFGEDDQECMIPEEWKRVPSMMESIDVMDFLGITRVKPLVVPKPFFRNSTQ
ncbi:hypothetical protein IV203_037716 [Nitzschia inconspicua]|uniref:Uncharacterized protein n=1 Tax=Nitzschia inconspicua TaxID=303405 RepID=A0A9K3Q185_9STRA|nr:hypothetical protein IV203_037716 [Nitzschia inconspicua]